MFPGQGIPRTLSDATVRKSTPRLHMARPLPQIGESDLYDVISITLEEAARGAKKLISIPFGYQKKTIVVRIPPGIRDGMKLRLEGMGRKRNSDQIPPGIGPVTDGCPVKFSVMGAFACHYPTVKPSLYIFNCQFID
jgi:hypothetical protein